MSKAHLASTPWYPLNVKRGIVFCTLLMSVRENILGIDSSLKALRGQIEGIEKHEGESLPLIKGINDRTSTIHQEAKDANQEHKARLETIDSHLGCVRNTTNESLPLIKDVDIRTRNIHQDVKAAAEDHSSSFQTLGSRVDDLCHLNKHSVPIIRGLDERTQNIHSDLQLVRPSIQGLEQKFELMIKSEYSRPLAELQASIAGLSALMTTKEARLTQVVRLYHSASIAYRLMRASKHTNRLLHELNINFLSKPSALQSACDTLRNEDPGFAGKQIWDVKRYRLCSCVPKRQTHDIWKGWRYWRLSRESYSQHSIKCSLYPNAQKTKTVRIRCMLPTWILSRMIDYTFSITSGAGGFAISPHLITLRIVHGYHSPAFSKVRLLNGLMVQEDRKGAVQLLEDILGGLRGLFCAGSASPFDVDKYGRTLFHVSYI